MFLRAIAMVLMFASVPAPSTSQVAPTHSPPKGFEQLQSNFPAPKTSFSDENLAGKTIDAFKGKIVVLNFWATWCTPCIAEMPALERLADRLPLAKFSVIAISQDRGGASVVKPFLDRIGVRSLPIYFDPQRRLSRDFGVLSSPQVLCHS